MVRLGFLADGVWKALVGVAMLALLRALVDELGAPGWLLGVTAAAVLASAAAEAAYAVRNGAGTHTKYLVAYDSGWVLVSVLALVLARSDVGLAWVLWLGYQLVAAPLLAVIFARGARVEGTPASTVPRRRPGRYWRA
ncbi:hypothetical protein GCM10009809_06110 [Isoptericola hypogeus]|uniref:Uncharacterized protein n=2 Tax=Isoptericola hypogeus TaxID=300179 RepID=A0ABP4UZD4_9MICO